MVVSPPHLLRLAEGMEARKAKGFRVSPETAPVVIEALRLSARMHAGEPAAYKVEKWDWRDQHVEEIVASTSLIVVARAAFDAAVQQYPNARLTLRQGIRVIQKAGP
jgi:hypothetical protein